MKTTFISGSSKLGLWATVEHAGVCGLSMKGLNARIKMHIKLKKGKKTGKKRSELIDSNGVGGEYLSMF